MANKYLDKDGLAHFWDNIKGEIGNASDAQVDDWLDRHPEATTTVQDGAITTAKLADGAVATAKLADGSVTDAKLAQSGGVLEAVGDLNDALVNSINNNILDNIFIETVCLLDGAMLFNELTEIQGRFGNNAVWYNINSNNTHSVIAVTPGQTILFGTLPAIAFLKSYSSPINGETADVVSGFSGIITTTNSTIRVPDDANYMVIMRKYSGEDRTSTEVYINGLSVTGAEKHIANMADLSHLAFDKQESCIHHDNFHRETTGDAWNIGRGAYEDLYTMFPQSYLMPYPYASVDDGFRIVDNVLVNDQSVSTPVANTDSAAFRLITSSSNLQDEYAFEMSIPDDGKWSDFVFNFVDVFNYEVIRVNTSGTTVAFIWKKIVDNVDTSEYLFQYAASNCTSVKFQSNGYGMKLYINGIYVNPINCTTNPTRFKALEGISWKTNLMVGLRIRKQQSYQYKFVALYNVVDFSSFDVGEFVDRDIVDNGFFMLAGTGVHSLSNTITDFSEKSQRLELIKDNVTPDPVTARIEYADVSRSRINNLRKYKISFDAYLPDGNVSGDPAYQNDTVGEVIFQMHDRHTVGGVNKETIPPVAIITKAIGDVEYWGFDLRGCVETNVVTQNIVFSDNEQLIPAETGKWTHFELFVKEGYMDAHNPLTILKIDGKIVYRTHAINAFNRAIGTYARYGIYKAAWEDADVRAACPYDSKIIYIDNFEMQI